MRFCRNKILLILTGCFLLLSSVPGQAEPLDLEQIVHWGLENAPAQEEMLVELEKGQRDIEKTLAGAGWQLDLRGVSNFNLEEREFPRQYVSLDLNRRFVPGLTLQGNLSYGKGPGGLGGGEYEPDLGISLAYQVFPRTPSSIRRELISRQVSLERLRNIFPQKQAQNILAWVEDYLNLARQEENLVAARQNLARVEEELEEILRRKEIEEAGEIQVIDSRVALLRAENSVLNQKQALERNREEFYRTLGLPGDREIELDLNTGLIDELDAWVANLGLAEMEEEEKIEAAFSNNPELKNLQLEMDYFAQQMDWFEQEQKPRVDVSGSIDGWHDDWGAGIGIEVRYNLFDSGKAELQEEDFEAQQEELENKKDDLKTSIKNQLSSLENAIQNSLSQIKEKELLLRRAELEAEIKEENYQKGLATTRDYNQSLQDLEKALLDYSVARDDLLIARLQLAYFLGYSFDWEQGVN